MALTCKDKIANYVYHNPRSPLSVITDASGLDNTCSASGVLSRPIKEGKVFRERQGRISVFSATPGYVPVIDWDSIPPKYSVSEKQAIEEKITELESRGMWRRAATLLAKLSCMEDTAHGVAIIALRRTLCVRNLRDRA
ncbi:hypothetical protein PL246_09765 [Salmonella enterica]|uniref:hypothetical protein n=1 Tax=Salmonella enterica TaxID=28901 RepID=UPI0018D08C20|nr:hypothetical protein [Salmonella enterica]MBH0365761.1 hypothetical protein [Salmonella enterica]MBH0484109.1 hypothetical protein [Salmonella enterica]MBH5273524.1 hypothetical protein [Salmonella enterica]MBH5281961.1 hypothetical protein [Salmonella enterica]MDO3888189.1 hypothetical protein [Salmonella enterica]